MTAKNILLSADVSTRSKRRQLVSLVICLLDRIRLAEEVNLERFPLSLRDSEAFFNAEESLDAITDAIVGLSDAY